MAGWLATWRLGRVEARLKKLRFEQHETRKALEALEVEQRTGKLAASDYASRHAKLESSRESLTTEIHALVARETALKQAARIQD
ncbi:MAG: hypothetical protein ACYDCK_14290 [Thermoplasmatota archaeon]